MAAATHLPARCGPLPVPQRHQPQDLQLPPGRQVAELPEEGRKQTPCTWDSSAAFPAMTCRASLPSPYHPGFQLCDCNTSSGVLDQSRAKALGHPAHDSHEALEKGLCIARGIVARGLQIQNCLQ